MSRTKHFFVFEGLDGSGKSTQCRRLSQALRQRGYTVIETREPTNGFWGQKIRQMAQSTERASAEQELEWFIKDRQEHIETVLLPALKEGKMIIQDRYFLSTMAYQGSRGLSPESILAQHLLFAPIPQRTFLLELPAQIGLQRVQQRQAKPDAFEQLESLEKCAEIFSQVKLDGLTRLNGEATEEELHRQIWEYVLSDLKQNEH